MSKTAAQPEDDTANRFRPDAPLAPNTKLGKYEIREQIGEGGCGIVYKGHDPFVDREVAVKVFHRTSDSRVTQQDTFFSEARAAGKLHHPYVVTLFDAGHADGRNYLVMEYVDGETLKKYCDIGAARLPLERVTKIMLKCCLALDYTHGRGVLHRDIKPGNIMVKRDGAPKIMDFSIASQTGAGAAGTTIVGSPMYMSPEQAGGKEMGPSSDLYSLGVVMYHVLTGAPPFEGKTAREILMHVKKTPVPNVLERRPDLPPEISKVFEKLLAKDPKARYQTGKELAQDLGPFSEPRAAAKAGRRKNLEISNDSLKQLKFFQAFKTKELAELMDASSTVTFQPGESIITEGETDNSLYILTMGVAEVHKGNRLIAVLEKGDCFGEIGFLYAVKRTASVVARTPVLLLKVNSALLDQMSEQCQLHYYKVFTENLIVRLSLTTERAAQLLQESDQALDFVLA